MKKRLEYSGTTKPPAPTGKKKESMTTTSNTLTTSVIPLVKNK
jgi:hypothetical protein